MNINIIIIITITILLIAFLLFYNKFSKKVPFDKELTSLPRSTIQTMFYPTDNIRESILTGTEALNNILDNKLNLNIFGIDDIFFQQEFTRKLRIYKSKGYDKDPHINKHLNYISRLLNISKKDCLNKYYDRIILAAALDYMLTNFQKETVIPSPGIIHEIISQLHEEGYEQLGCKALNYIFNQSKKPTHIITPIKKFIILRIWHNNLVIIHVHTDTLISKVTTPNKKHLLYTNFQIDIYNKEYLLENSLSYINTFFLVCLPYTMKNYIIEPTTETIHDHYSHKNPDHGILKELTYDKNHGTFKANYSMPNPQFNPLSKMEQSTNPTGYNFKKTMSHV